jgi:hypothetical protein
LGERHGVQAHRKGCGSYADNKNSFPSHDFLNLLSSSVPFIEYRYCAELHNPATPSPRNTLVGIITIFDLASPKKGEPSFCSWTKQAEDGRQFSLRALSGTNPRKLVFNHRPLASRKTHTHFACSDSSCCLMSSMFFFVASRNLPLINDRFNPGEHPLSASVLARLMYIK